MAFACASAPRAEAEWSPGPGRVLRPRAGVTDEMLFDKAMRIQARMWWHITPEGLLAYEHLQQDGPEGLSHAPLNLSDAAIWTGCYLGAQACRWHATRDPDALQQVGRLLAGVDGLTRVAGLRGRLCRGFGRLLPGRPHGDRVRSSKSMPGYHFLDDVSRDQLAGVVLGLGLVLRYVADVPDVQEKARDVLAHLAGRLDSDRMWLRTADGTKAKFGELRCDVEHLSFVRNGPLAALGYAPFATISAFDTGKYWRDRMSVLDKDGWPEALAEQHTWLDAQMSMTNVNMIHLGLLSIALFGNDKARHNARRGLWSLRKATRGWWNAGYCACQLLAGQKRAEQEILDEARVVLHVMTEDEIPPARGTYRRFRRIATARERGVVDWAWKIEVDEGNLAAPGSPPHPTKTTTRADWLFAYWLLRAAGYLRPATGPGAAEVPAPFPLDLPPWRTPSPR